MTETNAVPTINVNLRPCHCGMGDWRHEHRSGCDSATVLIPCPIPRLVTFEVVLGACTCPRGVLLPVYADGRHNTGCLARPVKVACSITGKTWEESEVAEVDVTRWEIGADDYEVRWLPACRERWALVKALVLNSPDALNLVGHRNYKAFTSQRDAVFAALADMARAEETHSAASGRASAAIYGAPRVIRAETEPESEEMLGRYVGRLIEQVGVLP